MTGCTRNGGEEEEPGTVAPPADEPAAPTARGGGSLRVGLTADPLTLDPRFLADEEGELVAGALFEPLVRVDADGRVLPGAATRWEVSDDGMTFEFTLRDQRFHDGTPVTADDFVRTFRRITDGTAEPPSFLAYLLAPVVGAEEAQATGAPLEGVTAVDSGTLRIVLTEPHPRYLLTLADPSLVPTPPAADEDPDAFAARPIGNGPFALAAAPEPGGFIRLTRVEDHHRPVQLDEVVLQVYPDDPARDRQWEALRDGLLQVADLGPSHRDDAVAAYGSSEDGQSGPGVLDGPTSTVFLLGFDLEREPFDDPTVRRAISQSIDRDALAEEVLAGTRVPADAIVPPAIVGSQPGVCDHCRFDPEGAAALLEEEGIELPDTLTFTHNRGPTQAAIARRVASDVGAALGVEVSLEPLDLDEFVPAVRRGEAPWFRLGWEVNAPDPGAYLDPLFHSRSVGLDNLTRYADEDTDALLDEARGAADEDAAIAAYREAERRILDAVAVAPLVVDERLKVVAPEVRGLVWDPTGRVDLARVRIVPER